MRIETCLSATKYIKPYILLIVLFFSYSAFGQGFASQIYKKDAPATVLIITDTSGGSGFITDSSGIIVTAYHVIDGAAKVTIKTNSGDVFDDVLLIAKDERKDIAILKIPGFDLHAVEMGNSNDISPGDSVVVLGNPLGLEELKTSISDGILSGVRDLGAGFKVLQITAPVSPGNSGGAIYSANGKVIGVVSFKLVKGENLNFGIPINYVRGLMDLADSKNPLSKWDKFSASASNPIPPGGEIATASDEGLQELLRTSIADFTASVEAGDFKTLRANSSKDFQATFSTAQLKTVFQTFLDKKSLVLPSLRAAQSTPAQFEGEPSLRTEKGYRILVVNGSFPSKPYAVKFEIEYEMEDGIWKLLTIKVKM